ncbi:MAG: helix-turn-helix domain-containing protein [Clostridia bacterium]|nr:helix-turn-helix domain-containing protein [Clostridia bacterium]
MIRLSENIAALRKARQLTQEQFAEVLKVSNQAVSKWESGKCYPDIELLPIIADFFKVSIDDLLRKDPDALQSMRAKPEDSLMEAAIKLGEERSELYTALLQRELGIGFSRATRIIEELRDLGYLIENPFESNKYMFFKIIK